MPKRLKSLKASEVSLVKRGAIKRPIFVLKSEQGHTMADLPTTNPFALTPEQDAAADALIAGLSARVSKADDNVGAPDMGQDEGLSERAKQALKAVYRILLPFKDEITDADLDALQDSIGIAEGEDNGVEVVDEDGNEVGNQQLVEQSADDKPTHQEDAMREDKEDVSKDATDGMDWSKMSKPDGMSDEDHKAAMDMAKGAYKAKMKASKATKDADGDKDKEDEPVEKSFDAVAKRYEESNKALIAKTASLESQIRKMHDERELGSIESDVRANFKHLAIDVTKTAKVLKSLKDTDKDAHDSYLESLRAADEQVKVSKSFGSGGLYGQMGQSPGGMGADGRYQAHTTSDAEGQLEALVDQHVGKGDCRTKADAWAAVLKTAKGAELYTQMAVEQNRSR